MTRRKRHLSLVLGAGVTLGLGLVLWSMWQEEKQHRQVVAAAKDSPDTSWVVDRLPPEDATTTIQLIEVEKRIHFEFRGDTRISPGSLIEMTRKMQRAETQFAIDREAQEGINRVEAGLPK